MTNEPHKTERQGKEELLKIIVDAFADVSCPFELADFSHDELVQSRFELSIMNDEAFQYVFPKIMNDIVRYYPHDLKGLDQVLDYVNVPSTIPSDELARINDLVGGHIAYIVTADEDKIKLHKSQSFKLFTAKQISALLSWLNLISTWSEARDSQHDLSSATNYWKQKLLAD